MPKFIKINRDAKKRREFNEKFRRNNKIVNYTKEKKNEKFLLQRFKNYCQITGAGKSIYSYFDISRHVFDYIQIRINFWSTIS